MKISESISQVPVTTLYVAVFEGYNMDCNKVHRHVVGVFPTREEAYAVRDQLYPVFPSLDNVVLQVYECELGKVRFS